MKVPGSKLVRLAFFFPFLFPSFSFIIFLNYSYHKNNCFSPRGLRFSLQGLRFGPRSFRFSPWVFVLVHGVLGRRSSFLGLCFRNTRRRTLHVSCAQEKMATCCLKLMFFLPLLLRQPIMGPTLLISVEQFQQILKLPERYG